MREIGELRQEIDKIDRQLIALFEQRMAVAAEVGAYKKARNLPVYDGEREQALLQNRVSQLTDKALAGYLEQFFVGIMDYSKDIQKTVMKAPASQEKCLVAYQGTEGAYSQQAARQFFPGCETAAKEDFESVFLAVSKKDVDYGVVPVENSATGSVTRNYDLLGSYGLFVAGEVLVHAEHVLLGLGAIEDVREVYSHEQGFLQCDAFLSEHKDWLRIPYHNTAVSAKHIRDMGDPAKAAIASRYAGEIYGLKVLKDNISNSRNNYTRFFVISREERPEGADKASLAFVVKHIAGSLVSVLDIFADQGYNLTKIESRPMHAKNWEYRFYADLEGDINELGVTMERAREHCVELELLGRYRKGSI